MRNRAITKSGTDPGYPQFLAGVEIYALGLDSLSAKVDREAYALAHSTKSPQTTREIENHCKLVECGDDHFDVRANLVLRVRNGDGEELLYISVVYIAHFHAEGKKLHRENAERFARTEARLIFWPYFRQVVADTTSRMFIRTITIPLTAKL